MEKPWSERVKFIRARLGLSQAGLANELRCHRNTIALWEMSNTEPRSLPAVIFKQMEKEVLEFDVPAAVVPTEWEG